MSRSYKKHNIVSATVHKEHNKVSKRKIRANQDIPNGGSFKKIYCSWMIRDYKMVCDTEETKRKQDLLIEVFFFMW